MKQKIESFIRRLRSDESGAVAALAAISIVALIGLTGLAIDIGNLVYTQRRLQATTDMSAFAGAQFIVAGTAIATARQYSAVNGVGNNTINAVTVAMASGYPQLTCDPNLINVVSCAGPTSQCASGCNAISVKQQATVPLIFAQWFGISSVQLSATSFAARGGGFPPMHIMIVLDNSGSMNDQDPTPGGATCGGIQHATRIQCALAGIQTLLAELWPTQDEVGLMVFPPLSNSTSAANDASCSTSASVKTTCAVTGNQQCTGEPIVIEPYSASSSQYSVVSLSSDYRSSNTSTGLANGTSSLVNATCQSNSTVTQNGVSSTCNSCAGLQVQGGEGTYLAGAITAAQTALANASAPGVQNVIIVLSDGGAGNAPTLWQGTANTSTLSGLTTLTFTTAVPSYVIPGTAVADNGLCNPTCPSNNNGDTLAIPSGTQVVSVSGASVVLSNAVTNLGAAKTSAAASASMTLTFASGALPSGLVKGTSVADSTSATAIPVGTTVTAATGTTVTLSAKVTVAKGDTIAFGFVGKSDSIAFGANNQCHESVTAAQDAATAGTWVYSIAYGSSIGVSQRNGTLILSPDPNGCSDVENPPISACQTMGGGETQTPPIQGIASDPTKFYSDPMGGSCTSADNPSATDIATIFANIASSFIYTQLIPVSLQ